MESKSKNRGSYVIPALAVIFLTTIYPFLIRGSAVKTGLENFFWYTGNGYDGDIYAYFRMKVFLILTAVSVLYMLAEIFSGKAKVFRHRVYIPMAIFCVMVFLSYFMSQYKQIALVGFSERYEGTFVLVGYMLIMFYAMNMLNDERVFKVIFFCFMAACALLGIWGALQVYGIDINNLPEWLYIPSKLRQAADLSGKMGADAVRWFFSNQNYSSFFMVFPICVSSMLVIASDRLQWKIAFAVVDTLMLYSLWNAASLGGMVGLAAAALAAIAVFGVRLVKWWKSIALIAAAVIVSAAVSLPNIIGEVKSANPVAMLTKTVYADDTQPEGLKFVTIDYIKTDGANIIFSFAGNENIIKTENNELTGVYAPDGTDIGTATDYMEVSQGTLDSSYNSIVVKTANRTWQFGLVEGEAYFVSPSGVGIKLDKVESFGFKNSQSFATYRGYIWSRTLPLLKDTLLIGHGADTFAVYFPQDDYAGRYNIGYYTDSQRIMIDKPHNMYLGTAVNTGVVSLIALIAVFVIYLLESFKIYRKSEYTKFIEYMGAGIFAAVFGFLVSGLVNDSTVQIMPVFYAFLGTGFAINRILKSKN
ncbi:O-antigen ligase family protein [Lachnospiraceae bacterium NSJ-143]|nr:O-antigen ligase family protein [Lachnospiraceae bacterium NSJ-143]